MAGVAPTQKQEHQPGRERELHTPKFPGIGKLKGKVAIITGGDSGIGRAVAVALCYVFLASDEAS